jgi:hypothetical protein
MAIVKFARAWPLVATVFIVWGVYSCVGTHSPPASPPTAAVTPADHLRTAKYACEGMVKRTLHDAGSAEFEPFYENQGTALPDDTFDVAVRLRAKNGFGALRSVVVDCRVRRSGDNWTAISVAARKR